MHKKRLLTRLPVVATSFLIILSIILRTFINKNGADNKSHRELLTTATFQLKQTASKENIKDIPAGVKSISGAAFFPSAKFARWAGFTDIKAALSQKSYELKSDYSDKEIKKIINYLSPDAEIKKNGSLYLAYRADKKKKSGTIIILDAKTGQFSYRSSDGITITEPQYNTINTVNGFLRDLGYNDETIKISATYKRRSAPGSVYYEIKRDWNLAGLPILNPIGLLNLDDNRLIKDLSFAPNYDSSPRDDDVYSTSDKSDGLSRKSDFNTLTIEISEKNLKIMSATSTLRKISSNINNNKIISYSEASRNLLTGKDSTIFTSPAGEGNGTPWEKIYPGKVAESHLAEITDSALAYLEQMPGIDQQRLEPYYVFRGRASLTSGYETYFVALVAANEENNSTSRNWFDYSLIPNANAQQYAPSQKQGTFILTEATPDPFPPTPTPNFTETCIPKVEDLNPRSTIQSSNGSDVLTVGRSHIAVILNKVQISRRGWWYFTPAPNSDQAILQSDYTRALILVQSVTNQTDFRRFYDTRYNPPGPMGVLVDYQNQGADCPIRITGESPTLFIYAPTGAKIDIKLPDRITYSDPALDDSHSWNATVDPDGKLLINNSYRRNYLYYEYEPAYMFKRPEEGWRVDRSGISKFSDILASQLQLNEQEKTRLVFEIKHAAEQVKSDDLFIGMIDKTELDKKLPLSVTQKDIKITRIHFYIDKFNDSDILSNSKVDSVSRSNKMILELGSYSP